MTTLICWHMCGVLQSRDADTESFLTGLKARMDRYNFDQQTSALLETASACTARMLYTILQQSQIALCCSPAVSPCVAALRQHKLTLNQPCSIRCLVDGHVIVYKCRAGMDLATVQVRMDNLKIEADIAVGSRGNPSVTNTFRNMAEVSLLHKHSKSQVW